MSGLLAFIDRDDYACYFEGVMGDHIRPVMETFRCDQDAIGKALGEHWTTTVWMCAFEDFLAQVFEPDNASVVDAYLAEHGWRETAEARASMRALAMAVMSLHAVSEIVPGRSFVAHDLIRGGDPVLVHNETLTTTLQPGECLAARIVPFEGQSSLTNAVLPLAPNTAQALMVALADIPGVQNDAAGALKLCDATLRVATPLFTQAFLFAVLPDILGVEVQQG